MITISLCMIVKNEEDVIGRCLDLAKDLVDEIIIVDTGSVDNTKKICEDYTDKIFDFKWIDNFSAARNFSFSKATMDYILWLDADDVILPDDITKFKKLKAELAKDVDIVMMKYNVAFDSNGKVTLSYYRERLSKRLNNNKWMEPVHEYLELGGKIINSDICITHKKEHPSAKGRNLSIYKNLVDQKKELTPRGLYYYARELYYNGLYDEAIQYFNKFLSTEKGWIEDNIASCSCLATCYSIKHDRKNMLKALLRSIEYDNPRAEICCKLGSYYADERNYEKAIFWYKLASESKAPEDSWGFINHDYYGYIPNIQLCVCFDKLGNIEEAIKYNEKAALFKPDDKSVLYNRKYFESIKK